MFYIRRYLENRGKKKKCLDFFLDNVFFSKKIRSYISY